MPASLSAVFAAFFALFLAPPETWAEERATLSGAIVSMPPIDSLDCAGMADVIARLDASNYRDPEAEDLSESHPDWPIRDYENRLTARKYFECTLGRSRDTDPGIAFKKK
ncbi:MAG: hypothetical protein AAGF44_01850 [Pseudomonadota bacterium]